jgi:uncharacterized protein (TIGR03000 family)
MSSTPGGVIVKRLFAGFVLALLGLAGTAGMVRADGGRCCPWPTSAAFPTVTPPGWYTNTYSYDWQYPWFAYYNYSQGPYANWFAGQGYAGYSNQKRIAVPGMVPATAFVTVFLPETATLSFSGVAATGTGGIRTFTTPVLEPNQDYAYEMTVEFVRNGKTHKMSKMVAVHPGENVKVTFDFEEKKETVPPPVKK